MPLQTPAGPHVPLPLREVSAGSYQARVLVSMNNAAVSQIRVRFGTYGRSPELNSASISDDSGCVWSAVGGSTLVDNAPLAFKPSDQDQSREHCFLRGAATLEVSTKVGGSLALWTVAGSEITLESPSVGVLEENSAQAIKAWSLGDAELPTQANAMKRFALLSAQWRGLFSAVELSVLWMVASLVLAASLALLVSASSVRLSTGAALGALAAVLALFVVFQPPLHTPDEPDHVLSHIDASREAGLLDGSSASTLQQDMELWAKELHFERVKFRPSESFGPSHVGVPFQLAFDGHVSAFDVAARSPVEHSLMLAVASVLKASAPQAHTLTLGLRLGVSVLSFLLMAVSVWALVLGKWRERGGEARALTFVLLAQPALFVFFTHVSNHGALAVGYVALISVALAPREKFLHALFLGAALGALLAFLLLAGRSGVVAFVVVALSFCAVATLRSSFAFWSSAAGALALLLFVVPHESFAQLLIPYCSRMLADHGVCSSDLLRSLALVGIAVLAFTDVIVRMVLRLAVVRKLAERESWIRLAVGLGFLCVVVLPLVKPPTPLANNEVENALAGFSYVVLAVPRFVQGLGPSLPDFYLNISYWSGFGWLDTRFPPMVLWLLKLLPVGLGLAVVFNARSGDCRHVVTAAWAFLLGIVSFGLLAYLVTFDSVNIHGRYLVSAYLLLTIPAALSLSRSRSNGEEASSALPMGGALACALAVSVLTALSLQLLATRYFS